MNLPDRHCNRRPRTACPRGRDQPDWGASRTQCCRRCVQGPRNHRRRLVGRLG
jgi:hypothetical protein